VVSFILILPLIGKCIGNLVDKLVALINRVTINIKLISLALFSMGFTIVIVFHWLKSFISIVIIVVNNKLSASSSNHMNEVVVGNELVLSGSRQTFLD